jgi:hypothetical protein
MIWFPFLRDLTRYSRRHAANDNGRNEQTMTPEGLEKLASYLDGYDDETAAEARRRAAEMRRCR